MTRSLANESETRAAGAELGRELSIGDVVLLHGPLGAGKTTLVRGLLEGLGYTEPVRSPTFNLLQVFDTRPRVVHADLYRVLSWQGLGLEEAMGDSVLLIEWPDRAEGLADPDDCWHVTLTFEGDGRRIEVVPPGSRCQPADA